MKTSFLAALIVFALLSNAAAQHIIKGIVNEPAANGTTQPLIGANVYIAGTTNGVVTDVNGKFELSVPHQNMNDNIVFSFVGYKNDTLSVMSAISGVNIVLKSEVELKEVTVTERRDGSFVSTIQPLKTEVITTAGLQKLACCNLSESFENSATVDVGFSDAVTGAKHIEMLGLSGIYTQMMTENIPSIRGYASTFGLGFVPGSWMESIQISKGTGSVINGYESATGQINIEYLKPKKADKLFVNLYGNSEGRMEANVATGIKFNDKLSTVFLGHASASPWHYDMNHDGFADLPTGQQFNMSSRWLYENGKNYHAQFGVNALTDKRQGGQMGYYHSETLPKESFYRIAADINMVQVYAKNGFALNRPETSLGIITQATHYDQQSFYGKNTYNNAQNSLYVNAIYQTIINNTNHKLSTGASYMFDRYDENLNNASTIRDEHVPGVFAQYTYTVPEKATVIAGIRTDWNSLHGLLFTPRLHAKYNFNTNSVLRGSIGMGYRSPNVIAENARYLASSRTLVFDQDFKIEQSVNAGINFTQKFEMSQKREATLTMDFYRTQFINQVVVDVDHDVHGVHFYNLDGKSYSNSFQADFTFEPIKRLDITTAFRWNDVKITQQNTLVEKPLVSRYKGLFTVSYATKYEKWQIDVTTQLNGKSRLPNTLQHPDGTQTEAYSPVYPMLYVQLTHRMRFLELYAGVENITNYMQMHPIMAADDPFGQHFDASMIWGPLMGRTFYGGLRYRIK